MIFANLKNWLGNYIETTKEGTMLKYENSFIMVIYENFFSCALDRKL